MTKIDYICSSPATVESNSFTNDLFVVGNSFYPFILHFIKNVLFLSLMLEKSLIFLFSLSQIIRKIEQILEHLVILSSAL